MDLDAFLDGFTDVMEMLKEGDITDMCVIGSTKDGNMVLSTFAGTDPVRLLGFIEMYKQHLINSISTGTLTSLQGDSIGNSNDWN
jgi:hypothetical protein